VYRRELLQRLRLPFTVAAPAVDETPLPGEPPAQLAQRLALAKAHAVGTLHPEAIVIGSDQVADLAGEPLGKPGDHARATAQLRRMRGQTVVFQTALAVVCAASACANDCHCVRLLSAACAATHALCSTARRTPSASASAAAALALSVAAIALR